MKEGILEVILEKQETLTHHSHMHAISHLKSPIADSIAILMDFANKVNMARRLLLSRTRSKNESPLHLFVASRIQMNGSLDALPEIAKQAKKYSCFKELLETIDTDGNNALQLSLTTEGAMEIKTQTLTQLLKMCNTSNDQNHLYDIKTLFINQNKDGNNALHLAIASGSHECAQMIVKNGYDFGELDVMLDQENNDGFTPEQLAEELQFPTSVLNLEYFTKLQCRIEMDGPIDAVLPCGHSACRKCLQAFVQQSGDCPFCRTPATIEDIGPLHIESMMCEIGMFNEVNAFLPCGHVGCKDCLQYIPKSRSGKCPHCPNSKKITNNDIKNLYI
eukprot:TRINITY_DN4514_c0_g1_i1.p1 TRINITY_DN4514_c0_g1~~TRINITY_DN4514_c0_g1_i1.p1  ORF type:complete len:387 (-),score=69.83 TRINITY_DN4514_c0_g1_i1:146-1144(-)